MRVLPGLLIVTLLAVLEQLAVATALPRIVGDLGGVSYLSGVVTAYTLASAITALFYSKLSDTYGRKKLLIAAIVIFLAGSALSGLSTSMAELITFRAVQGLGAGGLIVGAFAVIGEIVPSRERGRYFSYLLAVVAIATVGGPLAGGWITTALSWRWIFYINLPLGGAALVYLIAVMKLPARRVEHRIDYAGGIVLGAMATAVILLATWGGTEYPWGSWEIIGLLVVAAAALVVLLAVERRAAEPMLPLHLFKLRNFSVTMLLTFLVGFGTFGAMTFLPFYQQTVQGASPTVSGLLMTPLMVGSAAASTLVGELIRKIGMNRVFAIIGALVMAAGIFLLSRVGVSTAWWQTGIDYLVLGLGIGCLTQVISLIAHSSVALRDMGATSSTRMLFQQMGGSLGVAVLGAVFASKLSGPINPAAVNGLPHAVRPEVVPLIANALHDVFIFMLPSAIAVIVLALFIDQVQLRVRDSSDKQRQEEVLRDVAPW
jgi:EmrB/QacA subfamily drug resistance transporter